MDRAVWYYATCLNEDMDAAERALGEKPKPEHVTKARGDVYNEYMSVNNSQTTTAPPKGRFADPAVLFAGR